MSFGAYPYSPIVPPCTYVVNATFEGASDNPTSVTSALRGALATHFDAACRVNVVNVIIVAFGAVSGGGSQPQPGDDVAVAATNFLTSDVTAIARQLGFAFGLSTRCVAGVAWSAARCRHSVRVDGPLRGGCMRVTRDCGN